MEDQYSKMGEEKSASLSIGKRKMVKLKYTSLRKKYNILSPGGDFKSTTIHSSLMQ